MTALVLEGVVPAALLAIGFFAWLRQGGFGPRSAGLLSGLALAQGGMVVSVMQPGHSLWLAAGMTAVAASAANFVAGQGARRVIAFGGSLVALQVSAPLGGLFVAGMLPAAAAMKPAGGDLRKMIGLFALLLFMPAMTATVIFYLARVDHIALMNSGIESLRPDTSSGVAVWLASCLGLVVVPMPAQWGLRRALHSRAPLLVAWGALAAGLLAVFTDMTGDPVGLMAVAAPLTIAALAAWPRSRVRDRHVLTAGIVCAVLSWVFVIWSMPRPIAG